MTFKQELSHKADTYLAMLDIQKYMEGIKEQLNIFCNTRIYHVSLIKPHCSMAIGSSTHNHTTLFIPSNVEPESYYQRFITEFEKLGFNSTDLELKISKRENFDSYEITLKW